MTYRFDRLLGILLYLRSGQSITAAALAERFEVSTRTIHRDLKTLNAVGVPVYAVRGREGGFRLVEGYFLPPLMFAPGEAIALLLGLTLLRRLHARPFPAELDTVERKLLAAVPETVQAVLAGAETLIGFETLPCDTFHEERPPFTVPAPSVGQAEAESIIISTWIQAIFENTAVQLRYRSPYRPEAVERTATPLGLLWDRDLWYLAGRSMEGREGTRLWRADRVLGIDLGEPQSGARSEQEGFDVRTLTGRRWLQAAMENWRQESPVRIRLSAPQAEQLKQDWFYGHAAFTPLDDGAVVMAFGEDNQDIVLDLVRWLGPDAELLEPTEWRERLAHELGTMLDRYLPPAPSIQ